MANVEIGPEVSELIGAEGLAQVEQMAASGPYKCAACHRPGSAGQDASSAVLVRAAEPPVSILALAHRRCTASQIWDTAAVTVWPECDPQGYMWVSPQAARPHAQIFLDYPEGAVIKATPGGDSVDLLLTGLLAAGMELMRDGEGAPAC